MGDPRNPRRAEGPWNHECLPVLGEAGGGPALASWIT